MQETLNEIRRREWNRIFAEDKEKLAAYTKRCAEVEKRAAARSRANKINAAALENNDSLFKTDKPFRPYLE